MPAQPLGGLDAAPGDAVGDAAAGQPSPQVVEVIPLVGVQLAGPAGRGPRRDRIGGIPHTIGSRARLSWVLAAEIPTDSGSPARSTIRWIFDPYLPRSTGLGPVSSPFWWRGR